MSFGQKYTKGEHVHESTKVQALSITSRCKTFSPKNSHTSFASTHGTKYLHESNNTTPNPSKWAFHKRRI